MRLALSLIRKIRAKNIYEKLEPNMFHLFLVLIFCKTILLHHPTKVLKTLKLFVSFALSNLSTTRQEEKFFYWQL